ncbi:hypothetical protein XU18_2370 [Perkinsela sp. CCAP 1560/4]|nr:hypothetical protein XU18_2370 [Perkinsela sp. CCAP 1560/4]|eukprot:KNH06860.1 hypothetical protein XU18_2370 [Perkinsela sp. CCAP 1560/4]
MRFEFLFLGTVDPSVGRVDHESLAQQALMEMVIDGITNKEKICGDANEPKDIEEWEGVAIEDGEVVEIDWEACILKGSIHLEWLPSSVGIFDAFDNSLTAEPMEGHLFVVGYPSTPSWGKPGAFQTLVVFLFWRRPYRRPPQGGGSGPVPFHGEVQEAAACCFGSLVARRERH